MVVVLFLYHLWHYLWDVIQFTIQRNGGITNEFIKKSSGIPSLDRSGIRAIKASRLPPLPGGETRLTAEFWFEHSR